jgi:DNA-binding CsgD family transcriptional regulator
LRCPDDSAAADALIGVSSVVAGPLGDIAQRLSAYLQPIVPHEALVIFTRECTGRPRKVGGDASVTSRISIAEMQSLRADFIARTTTLNRGPLLLGGVKRPGLAMLHADTGIVLALAAKRAQETAISHVAAAFAVTATSIRHQVSYASPSYLAESRAASAERARTIVQMADQHGEVLTELLSVLRSSHIDDGRARSTAITLTGEALTKLRAAESFNRDMGEEPIADAFDKLCNELESCLRHKSVQVEYVPPLAEGRPIPGEVARGAAALVRSAAMVLVDQDAKVNRMRIAWECDGSNLVVELRDNGGSEGAAEAIRREATERARVLNAQLTLEFTPGWGTRLSVAVPLDFEVADRTPLSQLNARELEVLFYIARGWRNKAIGEALHITESTVKFHVTRLLQKLGVSNRAEAGGLAVSCGLLHVEHLGTTRLRRPALAP